MCMYSWKKTVCPVIEKKNIGSYCEEGRECIDWFGCIVCMAATGKTFVGTGGRETFACRDREENVMCSFRAERYIVYSMVYVLRFLYYVFFLSNLL